jgi:hypothetical protein
MEDSDEGCGCPAAYGEERCNSCAIGPANATDRTRMLQVRSCLLGEGMLHIMRANPESTRAYVDLIENPRVEITATIRGQVFSSGYKPSFGEAMASLWRCLENWAAWDTALVWFAP